MTTAPVLAQSANSNTATKLSVASAKDVRAGTVTKKGSNLSPGILIALLAGIAVIGGAVVLIDKNDDTPDSN